MAKRRILKKEIGYTAGNLFLEAMFCKLYLPGTNPEAADSIMARILDMQDNFICRAGKPDGKDNTKLVKAYYKIPNRTAAKHLFDLIISMSKTYDKSGEDSEHKEK